MIGQFLYDAEGDQSRVQLMLCDIGGTPGGVVSIPPHIVVSLRALKLPVRTIDEFMKLEFALGYAVTVAGIAGTGLLLLGEKDVWPSSWGELITRH